MAARLLAKFEMNEGVPTRWRFSGYDVFAVHLFLADAPEDAHAVTYILHETFYDPRRDVYRDPDGRFEERILTYGDFTVRVRIRRKSSVDLTERLLSDALRDYYADKMTPAIEEAISTIARH